MRPTVPVQTAEQPRARGENQPVEANAEGVGLRKRGRAGGGEGRHRYLYTRRDEPALRLEPALRVGGAPQVVHPEVRVLGTGEKFRHLTLAAPIRLQRPDVERIGREERVAHGLAVTGAGPDLDASPDACEVSASKAREDEPERHV